MALQAPAPETPAPPLDPVETTLLIPLAARARGGRLFPHMEVNDACGAAALTALGTEVGCFLRDRLSVYGVLSRTHLIRQLGQVFFQRHPQAWGVNLGCGLSCYFQWLDSGRNHWLDADLPRVMRWRQGLLPLQGPRHREAEVDLRTPGWWRRLRLPGGQDGQAVMLILEGVLMYQRPAQVRAILAEFADHAAPGSQLVCDALSWMAVGCGALHPSVRLTGAQFLWGARSMQDFTDAHPRLKLLSEHAVLDSYSLACACLCASFRATWGVPVYGVVRLGLRD